jgi:hypothetical protein
MEIEHLLTQYLHALEKGSYKTIIHLFTHDAVVNSPLYGSTKASHFYRELLDDTTHSTITVLHIFASEHVGAAHFLYQWTLTDGTVTSFECVDIAEFSTSGKIEKLTIIYDTYKVRAGFEKMKE